MENEHVLAGLVRKRAEIAGQLEVAQTQVRQLIIDVDNVDATIRLFAPDMDLEEIRPKPVPPRHTAFHGEISRIILTCLRETGLPLTTKDITLRVMGNRGLNIADPRLTWTVQKRVGANLRNLRAKGKVMSDHGKGSNLQWDWLDNPHARQADRGKPARDEGLRGRGKLAACPCHTPLVLGTSEQNEVPLRNEIAFVSLPVKVS